MWQCGARGNGHDSSEQHGPPDYAGRLVRRRSRPLSCAAHARQTAHLPRANNSVQALLALLGSFG